MFSGVTSLKGESANWAWDTSNVKYTDTMFVRASNFNQNIGSWDMSNVESMTRMFNDAAAFNNGGSSSISAWNTAKATSMEGVFWGAKAFNQPVGSWNVSNANHAVADEDAGVAEAVVVGDLQGCRLLPVYALCAFTGGW